VIDTQRVAHHPQLVDPPAVHPYPYDVEGAQELMLMNWQEALK
jgi:hypothetical protein